jgi:hypothetical protein
MFELFLQSTVCYSILRKFPEAVIFLTCIMEVLGLNPNQDTDYSEVICSHSLCIKIFRSQMSRKY